MKKCEDRIFSGKSSAKMWKEINTARSTRKLRNALYTVCCNIQRLEELVKRRLK